jgi:VWFA-related protein
MKRAAWAWVLCLPATALTAQEVPVFSTNVEVVRVDVAVLRDGRPVQGLTAADFEVRDNGIRQSTQMVGDPHGDPGVEKPIDVVLALDLSDSVRGEPLRQLKAAAHAFVGLLRPEDSFSLLTFSSGVRLAVSRADSRARAHEVIEATQAESTTSLYDATFAAVVTADATRGRPLALILSDGDDHGSWLKPEQVLRAAEASDLVAHAVFVQQSGGEPAFLRALATATGGEAWRADYSQLEETLSRALEEFRSRYTLVYERTGTSRAGWHELDVRVRRSGVRVRARRGYLEPGTQGERRR